MALDDIRVINTNPNLKPCPYCSHDGCKVYHYGVCPKVKAIEYYPDGTIKRIEYKEVN